MHLDCLSYAKQSLEKCNSGNDANVLELNTFK